MFFDVLPSLATGFLVAVAWWLAFSAAFGIFEHFWPGGRRTSFLARFRNLRILLVSGLTWIVLYPAHGWVIPHLYYLSGVHSEGLIGMAVPGWKAGGGPFWQILIAFVYGFVWDFFQYWTHRMEHEAPGLWRYHRLHHSDEDMSSSTVGRKSFVSRTIEFFCIGFPTLLIAGTNVLDVVSAFVMFTIWGHFNHANLRLNLGPLTPIFSGPQLHRLHHGKASEYHDSNYAAYFPVLDILFGTYKAPRADEYPDTGVDDDIKFAAPELEVFIPLTRPANPPTESSRHSNPIKRLFLSWWSAKGN